MKFLNLTMDQLKKFVKNFTQIGLSLKCYHFCLILLILLYFFSIVVVVIMLNFIMQFLFRSKKIFEF